MRGSKSFEDYVQKHEQWADKMQTIRALLLKAGYEEAIKWGQPTYMIDGKNLIGLGAFKNHLGIWFFQGVFLKDEHKRLRNAQEGKTKGMRSLAFTTEDKINKKEVMQFLKETIANHKQGLKVKPDAPKKLVVPAELKAAFKADKALKAKFEALTPGKQREYAEYVNEAKQDKTKIRRVEKCIPLITAGAGLHDRYK